MLNLGARVCSAGAGFVKSSKLIMNNDISSTSDRIGAMTSEHKNVCPVKEWTKFKPFDFKSKNKKDYHFFDNIKFRNVFQSHWIVLL